MLVSAHILCTCRLLSFTNHSFCLFFCQANGTLPRSSSIEYNEEDVHWEYLRSVHLQKKRRSDTLGLMTEERKPTQHRPSWRVKHNLLCEVVRSDLYAKYCRLAKNAKLDGSDETGSLHLQKEKKVSLPQELTSANSQQVRVLVLI